MAGMLFDLAKQSVDTCLGLDRFLRCLKTDDTANWPTLGQHVNDLNPGAFHIMQHAVNARGEVTVGNKSWRGDDQACGGRQQAFVNAAGEFGHAGIAATGGDSAESVDHAGNGSEQAQQRGEESDRSQHRKKAFQLRYLQLRRFLHNVSVFGTLLYVPVTCSVYATPYLSLRVGRN